MGLVYTGPTPPPWITIDGVNNLVIARAHFFTGATQAAANAAAQAALNAWVTAALANGTLSCASCTAPVIGDTGSGAPREMVVNGTFAVAVGQSHIIRTSSDGVNWTTRDSGLPPVPGPVNLASVAYGAGLYVAMGQLGSITTSPNGTTWTPQTYVGVNQFNGLAFGNNLFVAGDDGGDIYTSLNGINWTALTTLSQGIDKLRYGGGQFIAVGANGLIATSPTGAVWTEQVSGTSEELWACQYGQGVYVAVGTNGAALWSADGAVWNVVVPFTASNIIALGFGMDVFVAATDTGEVWMSSDGAVWLHFLPDYYFLAMMDFYGDCRFITNEALIGNDTVYNSPCTNPDTIHFTGVLPPWITIDVLSNRFVGAANTYLSGTKEDANTQAQTALDDFVTTALGNATLTCEPPGTPVFRICSYGSGPPFFVEACADASVSPEWDGTFPNIDDSGAPWRTIQANDVALDGKDTDGGFDIYLFGDTTGSVPWLLVISVEAPFFPPCNNIVWWGYQAAPSASPLGTYFVDLGQSPSSGFIATIDICFS